MVVTLPEQFAFSLSPTSTTNSITITIDGMHLTQLSLTKTGGRASTQMVGGAGEEEIFDICRQCRCQHH